MPDGPEPMTAARLPEAGWTSNGTGALAPSAWALSTWSPA